MNETDIEKRFAILCQIVRAQHFAWREALRRLGPDLDVRAAVEAMWHVTGRQTADAYLKRIDVSLPLAPQVAEQIVFSSRCMGEDASVESVGGQDEAYVSHAACPWFDWHRREHLLEEDRVGCDSWFKSTAKYVNQALGTRLRVETLETLPDGDTRCRRRLWVEDESAASKDTNL